MTPNPSNGNERLPDEGNPARFEAFLARDQATVVYYGKLIENKGVQILLEALRGLDARLIACGGDTSGVAARRRPARPLLWRTTARVLPRR